MALILGHSQVKYMHEYLVSDIIVTLCYPGYQICDFLDMKVVREMVPSFSVVVILAGANDLPYSDRKTVIEDLQELSQEIRSYNPRKRNRSPNSDCEDCLPISKRITRLQIQSGTRLSVEEKEDEQQPTPGSSCQSSPDVQSPWQQQNSITTSPVGYGGNNNNLNYLPCSSQCDNSRNLNPNFTDRLSVQAYATHHGIREEDLRGYNPDLNRSENPHYYNINSVLYNAHIEKARRFDMSQKFS